jgi:tRNA pseudouridine-54 N-methylase
MVEKEMNAVKETREQFFVLGDHQQVAKIDKKL